MAANLAFLTAATLLRWIQFTRGNQTLEQPCRFAALTVAVTGLATRLSESGVTAAQKKVDVRVLPICGHADQSVSIAAAAYAIAKLLKNPKL